MMNFDFSAVVNNSQSNIKAKLEGNAIHNVKFKGCFVRESEPNAAKPYKVIDIKFANEEGEFTHCVWAPKEEDYKDRETFGIKNPANIWNIIYLYKHLVDAVNPKLAKMFNDKEKTIDSKTWMNWDSIKKVFLESTKNCADVDVQIKLIKNKKGEAIFPYFLNYSREGNMYMSTNFIGEKLYWTDKEQQNLAKAKNTPTTPSMSDNLGMGSEDSSSDLDFNF